MNCVCDRVHILTSVRSYRQLQPAVCNLAMVDGLRCSGMAGVEWMKGDEVHGRFRPKRHRTAAGESGGAGGCFLF